MTLYCVGAVTTRSGDIMKRWADGTVSNIGDVPASAFATRQPVGLQLCRLHDEDQPLGEVKFLAVYDRMLHVVGEVNPSAREDGLGYFSASLSDMIGRREVIGRGDVQWWTKLRDAKISHVALVGTPAQIGLPKVEYFTRLDGGDLPPNSIGASRYLPVVQAAREHLRERNYISDLQRPKHLEIANLDAPAVDDELALLDQPAVIPGIGRPLARERYDQPRILRRTFATVITMR